MFILKKLVSRLFFPLPLSIELALLGLAFLWFTRRQSLGKALVTLSVLLLLVSSTLPLANSLGRSMDSQYVPYGTKDEFVVPEEDVAFVVVLAGGAPAHPDYPVTRQIGGFSTIRLVEAYRIHQRCPNSKMVLAGGRGADPNAPTDTLTNFRFVSMLGAEPQDTIVQNISRDTDDEARNVKSVVGDEPFVLVTSVWHMPRAIALFERQGMHPIPGPTDYRAGVRKGYVAEDVFPSSDHLRTTEIAVYEFLGTLWSKINGLI